MLSLEGIDVLECAAEMLDISTLRCCAWNVMLWIDERIMLHTLLEPDIY